MLRLVQIQHDGGERRAARVEDDRLRVLAGASVYEYAQAALEGGRSLAAVIERAASVSSQMLDYDVVYAQRGEWRLLPAYDHPGEPARCLVSGTGLTHRKSADNRNAMHQTATTANANPAADVPSPAPTDAKPTDSMTIYAWGEQGGRPLPGQIGAQPEWFYKGSGTILRAHGQPLDIPAYAEDGGEEAEIAGIYLIDAQGDPRRIGFAQANEFSDHIMEARNYLYLAPSKLRACALGPELLVPDTGGNENESENIFTDVRGDVMLMRQNDMLWRQEIRSGSANMVHTLANLEHHHFKYAAHRRPGDAHVHFFGTGGFSFGSGIMLEDGDTMTVSFEGYGRPLVNTVRVEAGPPTMCASHPI